MAKKRIYILLSAVAALMMFVWTPVAAQHYVGVRAGWGGGSARFYPKADESGTVWGLYHGGLSWKYYSREKSIGGVQVDILFMQQGFRNYDLSYVPPGSDEQATRLNYYQRTVNTITIPAYWQSYAYLFERRMRVFLNLGVTLSYNYSSREEFYSYEKPEENYSRKYPMQLNRDNPLTYGLGGGFGIGWSFGRVEVLAEARYFFGYGDILRNRNRYELNPLRSPMDNMQIAVGVYWRLGKGGILAPPGPKLAAKMQAAEERREAQRLQKEIDQANKEAEQIMKDGGPDPRMKPEPDAVLQLDAPTAENPSEVATGSDDPTRVPVEIVIPAGSDMKPQPEDVYSEGSAEGNLEL